jgi:tetratricopeptide (TPR) repeat protein
MKILRFALAGLLLPVLTPAQAQTERPPTAAEIKRDKLVGLNQLITQTNAAMQAKDWPQTKDLVGKLIAANAELAAAYPGDASFPGSAPEYAKLLGDAHLNLGEYDDAIVAYDKSIGLAQAFLDGGKDSPGLKTTLGQALVSKGNAFLNLQKSKEATACYEQAAPFMANPATAWFNICAVRYNQGDMDGAVAAADKAIALDPAKADAYFIKGSVLFGNATVDAGGKMVVPPEALAALRKYLELAPQGPHADDVKQMLDAVGASTK